MASSEELKIIIDATAAGAKAAINDLKSHFDGLGGRIGHAAKVGAAAMGAAGVAIGGAMMKAVADTVKYAESIDKVNKETGIATDQVQRFAYAAEQEHTSLDALEKGFGFLAKNMDANAKSFTDLGIATKEADGSLRNTGDVMLDLADYMSAETDETKKAVIAKQLLGKAGVEMIPFLSMGREEIKRLGLEAGDLGMVLEDETIKAMEAFGDQVDKMKNSAKGLEMQIGTALLPAFSEATDAITEMFVSLRESGDMEKVFGNIGGLIKDLVPTFEGLFAVAGEIMDAFGPVIGDVLRRLGEVFKTLAHALVDSGIMDQIAKLVELLADAFMDIFEAAAPIIEEFFRAFAEVLEAIMPIIKTILNVITEVVTGIVDLFTGGAASARKAMADIKDSIKELEKGWNDLTEAEKENAIASYEAAAAMLEQFGGDQYAEHVRVLRDEIEKMSLAIDSNIEGINDWADTWRPFEDKAVAGFERIEEGWNSLTQTQREAVIAQIEAAQDLLRSWDANKYKEQIDAMEQELTRLRDHVEVNFDNIGAMGDKLNTMLQGDFDQIVVELRKSGEKMAEGVGQKVPDQIVEEWYNAHGRMKEALTAGLEGGINGMMRKWDTQGKGDIQGLKAEMISILHDPAKYGEIGADNVHQYAQNLATQFGIDEKYVSSIEQILTQYFVLHGQAGPLGQTTGGDFTGQLGAALDWGKRNQIDPNIGAIQGSIDSVHGKDVQINVQGSISERARGIMDALSQAGLLPWPLTVMLNLIARDRHTGGLIMHGGGAVPSAHVGALIGGLKSDERIIKAQTREFMMQRSAVDRYGVGFMEDVNAGRYQGGTVVQLKGPVQAIFPNVSTERDMNGVALKLVNDITELAEGRRRYRGN